MVKMSRRKYRHFQIPIEQYWNKVFIKSIDSENIFDLCRIYLCELLDFYQGSIGSKNPAAAPKLFLSLVANNNFSTIKIVVRLSGASFGFNVN